MLFFGRSRNFHPGSIAYLSDHLTSLIRGRLWLKVLIGLFLGVVVGILIGPSMGLLEPGTAALVGNWLAFPGQLFLALIQMIVIPLVVASIVRGLAASESGTQLRSMGLRVTIFFLTTTALAILIGVVVATLIQPGRFIDSELLQERLSSASPVVAQDHAVAAPTLEELPAKLINLLPVNPLTSMVEGQMLQLVLFSIIVGVALVMMPAAQAKPLLDLLGSLQEVSMTVVRWAMVLAPVAVFGLMAQLITKIGFDALVGMGVYVATVLLGLATMFAIYLVIMYIATGFSPRRFIGAAREVLLLAFSTSSSAAVMPLTIKTAEEKFHVRYGVSRFVIPLGATINMNGTALYQGVATIFLAQVFNVDIGLSGILLLLLLAVGASIGSPATPGVGIVILALVLDAVGVPTAGIALIMGVDRILDMSRTAINVSGDLVASALIDRWLGGAAEEQQAGSSVLHEVLGKIEETDKA